MGKLLPCSVMLLLFLPCAVLYADLTTFHDDQSAGTASATPVPNRPYRLQWKYATGHVQTEYSGKWTQKNGAGTFHYVDKGRTADHVELYDKSRDYTLRLTASALLIKGGNDRAKVKYADFTKLQDGKWTAEFPLLELGKLSEKYESGGRGPGTVSSGVGDPGGVSYGTYQLASKIGRADAFVKRYYPKEFAGLKGGTPEFTARWKELVKKDPAGLHENEHAYIKETHHDPQIRKLASKLKLDVGARSRVFQDVVWSVAVQHGPNTSMIVNALEPLVKTKPAAQLTDEEMIRAIYTERSRKNDNDKLVYGSRLNARWTAALLRRFASERQDALGALEAK